MNRDPAIARLLTAQNRLTENYKRERDQAVAQRDHYRAELKTALVQLQQAHATIAILDNRGYMDVLALASEVETHIQWSGETYADVAYRARYVHRGRGDTGALKRRLGIKPNSTGQYSTRIQKKTALRIIQAIGKDPHDFGL